MNNWWPAVSFWWPRHRPKTGQGNSSDKLANSLLLTFYPALWPLKEIEKKRERKWGCCDKLMFAAFKSSALIIESHLSRVNWGREKVSQLAHKQTDTRSTELTIMICRDLIKLSCYSPLPREPSDPMSLKPFNGTSLFFSLSTLTLAETVQCSEERNGR